VALEQAGVPLAAVNDLTSIQTVEDLRKLVQQSGRRAAVEDVLWTFLNRKEFLGNH
jgi:long-chain acyl-CoA synthetase